MDNQKIILITHEYPPKRGGAGTYCEELVFASLKEGLNIEAWIPSYGKKQNHIKILPLKGSQDWVCSFKLYKELHKFVTLLTSNSVLHFAEPGSLRAIVRFGWLIKNLPNFIITIHGTELVRFSKNPIEKILFVRVLQKAKKIHVLSKFNKEELLKICPNICNKILLFPGAAGRNLVNKNKQKKQNKNSNRLQVLCVARIHPRKGQDLVIKALKSLPKKYRHVIDCIFVGPIIKANFYKKLLKLTENLDFNITFLGDIEDQDLKKIYQTSDIFILPSMPRANSIEGFGFVYLESSSHGLPILAHKIGGVENAVKDGITGILTDHKRPNELRSSLKRLVEDKNLRIKMGQAGKKWANKHSWSNLANELYKPTGHQQMQGVID